jgi:hypothetical protein
VKEQNNAYQNPIHTFNSKVQYNWHELLVLTGYYPEMGQDGATILNPGNYNQDQFLDDLLQKTNAQYEHDGSLYIFRSEAPDTNAWFRLLLENESGYESGSWIDPSAIEFPMNAIVMQFIRLGLGTVESCRGFHGRRQRFRMGKPYVIFETSRDAILAETMLKAGAYNCRLFGQNRRLVINEEIDTILEIGLWLSAVTSLAGYEKLLRAKRELRLMHLLDIPGETGKERLVGAYLLRTLKQYPGNAWMDASGNVLAEIVIGKPREDMPCILLSAHQDVKNDTGVGHKIVVDGNIVCREAGILGADDRAGIAAILNGLETLNKHRYPCRLKLAFPVGEEEGQYGAEAIDPSFFEGVEFGMSLDRRGSNDIVYYSSNYTYAQKNQTEFIERFSRYLWDDERYHYKACRGWVSDLRVWSQMGIPSVNLSIGYEGEHYPGESLDLDAWHRAQDLLLETITQVDHKDLKS